MTLKERLLKLKIAAIKPATPEARRDVIQKTKRKDTSKKTTQSRLEQEKDYINVGKPIRPTGEDAKMTTETKRKLAKLKEQKIAKEHGHAIVVKSHERGVYRQASLEGQQGKYAKYWLLNAKQTNGNGWGIASHTAKENMQKFIGRPLVVTSSKWHGASVYGEAYEHPFIPTDDLNQIFAHQEQFRVGNIVEVGEKNGDYYATIEMLPKFASYSLPPFCSPAIYQLDAQEHEGSISKWEALHLAALDENPAYGARIALLKGTCVGTAQSCSVQFKSAKQKSAIVRSPDKYKVPREMKHTRVDSSGPLINKVPFGEEDRSTSQQYVDRQMRESSYELSKGKKVRPKKPTQKDRKRIIAAKSKLANIFDEQIANEEDTKSNEVARYRKRRPSQMSDKMKLRQFNRHRAEMGLDPVKQKEASVICPKKKKNLKERLASLGEQNMTYQDSKKVKIRKKKHPEVRKAQSNVEDILRKSGRSVDASHAQSTFLSPTGDFIGGEGSHTEQINKILGRPSGEPENAKLIQQFEKDYNLPKVQNFPINRAGEKRTSVGISSPISKTQLKSIQDLETGGQVVGYAVGPTGKEITGEGTRDLIKTLKEQRLLK